MADPTRRNVLAMLAGCGACSLAPHLVWAAVETGEALYYSRNSDGSAQCEACPNACHIPLGGMGRCRTRQNRKGVLYELAYGRPAMAHIDPIEKGPTFHAWPGIDALAIGTAGCNLSCKYCQNWELSQVSPLRAESLDMSPADVVGRAADQNLKAVSFTYTEPLVALRYLSETIDRAKEKGMLTQIVTGSYLNPRPLKEVAGRADIVVAALKGFEESFYQEVVGGSLKPVLTALESLRDAGPWIEIVNLVVPGLNDDISTICRMCKWLNANLGPDVPLHFLRFFPAYRLRNLPRTPVSTLEAARRAAMDEGLRYVYLGNVPGHDANQTYCHGCNRKLITRVGFRVVSNELRDGRCPDCGTTIPGRF